MEFEEKEEPEGRREKMSQEPRMGNLVDTTDCLEAVSVIKCWKNLLFIIILLGLLLLQGSFWMMNLKLVKADEVLADTAANKIKQAARQIAADTNVPAEPNTQQSQQAGAEPNQPAPVEFTVRFELTVKHIKALVRFLNLILIPGAVLYCLTMLFSLKVSLIGRLGGINHIARAFFMSLLFVVLLLPWQLLFSPLFGGAIFTPAELITACQAQKTTLALASFYLRFVGYWVLVLLLLLAAQIRSMRWAKATLRRLEVV
jgi:hypothetical protein